MNDNDRVELNELCSALVDGTLAADGRARLQEMLRTSDEARRFYVRAMQLSASLHSYASEMLSEPANIIRPAQWRRALIPLAAAAVIALGVWISGVLAPKPAIAPDDEDTIARVTGGKDCRWIGAAFSTGDEIAAGQRIELQSGVAEITFDSGALLTVEGPAMLDLRSAWETGLERGTVKANVPQEAIGFRVVHATVEVVDLGTEFSISADGGGEAEVFVHQGAVEVHPRDTRGDRQQKSILREKQARRFAKAGGGDVRDNSAARWQKLSAKAVIERIAKPATIARWSFDESSGATAPVTGGGAKAAILSRDVPRVPGRFGRALDLDGTLTARAELSGPLKRGARTIAFWARVPEDADEPGTFATFPVGKSALDLAWNRFPADGVTGALRMQAAPGIITGSTPLRDGRWHHIAAVFAPKKDGRPAMKLYVDGRLDAISGRRPAQTRPGTEHDAFLQLGGDKFRGQLDELILADQQLTPQEIKHLMRTNTLLTVEALAGL